MDIKDRKELLAIALTGPISVTLSNIVVKFGKSIACAKSSSLLSPLPIAEREGEGEKKAIGNDYNGVINVIPDRPAGAIWDLATSGELLLRFFLTTRGFFRFTPPRVRGFRGLDARTTGGSRFTNGRTGSPGRTTARSRRSYRGTSPSSGSGCWRTNARTGCGCWRTNLATRSSCWRTNFSTGSTHRGTNGRTRGSCWRPNAGSNRLRTRTATTRGYWWTDPLTGSGCWRTNLSTWSGRRGTDAGSNGPWGRTDATRGCRGTNVMAGSGSRTDTPARSGCLKKCNLLPSIPNRRQET